MFRGTARQDGWAFSERRLTEQLEKISRINMPSDKKYENEIPDRSLIFLQNPWNIQYVVND